MPTQLIIVENNHDWHKDFPNAEVVNVKDYISQERFFKLKNTRVINLCRNYSYLGIGYYCSLLAAARKHKPIPSIRTITELNSKSIYSLNIGDLDMLVQKSLDKQQTNSSTTEFLIYFGQCQESSLVELARQIFDLFRCPLLKVELRRQEKWEIASIKSNSLHHLNTQQRQFFCDSFARFSAQRWQQPKTPKSPRFDMAVLYDPGEKLPPSNAKALKKFISAGKKSGINVELIEKRDYSSLLEYDALFIRETTQINHHTYKFAKRAENEGLVVIDDPDSIVKCTNKVYLAELLTANGINTPKTVILKEDDLKRSKKMLSLSHFPMVLKIPDSSFSRGVFKVQDPAEFLDVAKKLFEDSDLILAQEYLYTDFDWRIGVFNRKPLFACQYFMSHKHWQIVKHSSSGRFSEGKFRTLAIEDVPPHILDAALKSANLIGNGLYGVDVKEIDNKPYVIEVNDNPNIDAGVEDHLLGDSLYQCIIDEFIRRIEIKKSVTNEY